MKNILKKSIAIIMSACMLMSVTSASVISTSAAEVSSIAIAKNKSEVFTSGNLNYTILEDGTAQIEGTAVKELKKIEVPSKIDGYTVTKIGPNAFENEVASEIILPDTLTEIGYYAFCNCDNIKTLELPEGVTKIKEFTFSSCSNLVSLVLPRSVTHIDNFAIQYCGRLREITFKSTALYIDQFSIEAYSLTKLNFAENIEHLYFYADSVKSNALTTLNIPDSAKDVRFVDWAFDGCPNLSEINIPEKGVHISQMTFFQTQWYKNQPDGIVMLGNYLIDYKGEWKEGAFFSIPDGVCGIADGAFNSLNGVWESLEKVEFPDSLEYIGRYAFQGCKKLKKIVIPDSVTQIMNSAFLGCEGLETVIVGKNVTKIDRYAFYDCPSLEIIEIPANVTEIGERALGYTKTGFSYPNIYGYKNSAAEEYAKKCRVSFRAINDVDRDKHIDVIDVTALQMRIAGYKVLADDFNCDVNKDEKIDVSDVIKLQLILAGIE